MAILGNIRKRTTVLILIIGLALFAFVISGVFSSNELAGGKVSSAIAEVNGTSIPREEFAQKMEQASRRYGTNFSSSQLLNTVYDQEVRKIILDEQFEDLGIAIETDQIVDFVKNNPNYAQIPDFQDDNGVFNAEVFRAAIADWQVNQPFRFDAWLQDENNIIQSTKEQMYFNLVKAGVGATLAEGEFDYKLQSDKVDLEYVRVPYTSIPDSTIFVSNDEIDAYIKEHEDAYKQEVARDIRFVFFEEKASEEDETAITDELNKLLEDTVEYNEVTKATDTVPGFRSTTDYADFLDRKSDTKYDTILKSKKELPSVAVDSITALAIGELYGPYRDGDFFKVTKMVEKRPGGSVKASHILFAYKGAERANDEVTRAKAEARSLAEEILVEAKKPNADFAALARENSDGPSAPRGGDLGFFEDGAMVEPFNDFCFKNEVGTIGLVETTFGFHIIKVTDKEDVVRIATLTRSVAPSDATSANIFTETTTFELATTDADPEDFANIAKEESYSVRPVNKVKAMDQSLPGLGQQRGIVQWAFNDDTDVGDIRRFDLANGYAVVQLTKKYKEGLQAAQDASAIVTPILRKQKKAQQIIAANKGKTIEDFGTDNNVVKSTATAVSVKSPTIPGAGREPLVVGRAFAMNEGDVSALIEGESGVFMIKVNKKTPATELENFSTFANTLGNQNRNAVNAQVFNALREASEIEDNRAIFY